MNTFLTALDAQAAMFRWKDSQPSDSCIRFMAKEPLFRAERSLKGSVELP